jgi:hypothetical protein
MHADDDIQTPSQVQATPGGAPAKLERADVSKGSAPMHSDDAKQTPSQLRAMYLELNRNESRVLYERLKGMLTFQGLLFAAIGVSASKQYFTIALLIAIVGGLACIPWAIAVLVSYRGEQKIGESFNAFNDGLGEDRRLPPLDAVDVRPWEFWLLPEVLLPGVVGLTWVGIILYLAWAYTNGTLAQTPSPAREAESKTQFVQRSSPPSAFALNSGSLYEYCASRPNLFFRKASSEVSFQPWVSTKITGDAWRAGPLSLEARSQTRR